MSTEYNTEREIKKILKKVKQRKILPREGYQKIQELNYENSNESIQQDSHSETELVGKAQPVAKDIAIIGMSGRFPGANTVEELWGNLSEGKSSITEIPKERWDIDAYFDPDVKKLDKTNSRWGGFLADVDKFDPLFFNISGMEAEVMDPQQRLFLQECWNSLEDAGYANDSISNKKCGVYVGVGPSDYLIKMIEEQVQGGGQAYWGNSASVLASRISYFLNLKGPAVTVDTACSSSLVAMHLACQAIISGEIEMAIAGGVVICNAPYYFVATSNAGMLSPNGMCMSFDNSANGIVNGEAVGAVILKPLAQAVKDGDNIYGVIKSSGINQDGKTNGITAPSTLSQTELELEVYRKGDINPETINYIEAHGTGTKLGDPIEIEALTNSFQKFTAKKQFCAIGSIKTNIGHTAPAAGVASVIKVLLALKYKKIPPSLNFKQENEHIFFKETPFYVNTILQDWTPNQDGIRRAAVSSFGFSGTNAHLVIEEAPQIERGHSEMPGYLIVLSARSMEQLCQQAEQLIRFCEIKPQTDCGDMSYTLLLGRKHFNHRLACIVSSQQELTTLLKNWLEKGDKAQIFLAKLSDINFREQLTQKRYGNQCLQECQNIIRTDDYLEHLTAIADLYVQGYRLEFEKLFANEQYSKISLPSYPFNKERYWALDKEVDSAGSSPAMTRSISESEVYGTLLLQPDWREQEIVRSQVLEVASTSVYSQQLVILCELDQVSQDHMATIMEKVAQTHRCLVFQSKENENRIDKRFITYAEQAFTEIKNILKDKPTGKVLIQIVISTQGEQQLFSGLLGLLKTARLENSKLIGQLIEVEPKENSEKIIERLRQNSQSPLDNWIRYREGKRWVPGLKTVEIPQEYRGIPWRDNGIYLIAGGAGGLGLIFAREIVNKVKNPTLILTGRSALDNDKQAQFKELQAIGARIEYRQVDVTQREDVFKLIQIILADFGSLNGIIQAAGVIRDNFILKKSKEEMEEVLEPKVAGTVNLDEACRDLPLDFLILFSSVTGMVGNPGQADYATANAFMDAYAKYRNALVASQQRQGRTLALNWPLWKEGGMHVDEATEKIMLGKAGTIPLRTSTGIRALYQSLDSGQDQVLVMEGKLAQMKQSLLSIVTPDTAPLMSTLAVSDNSIKIDTGSLIAKVEAALAQIMSDILKVKLQYIDEDAELSAFGFDSLTLTEFVNIINRKYQVDLNPTIFFEYSTLHSLATYLVEEYQDIFAPQFTAQTKAKIPVRTPVEESRVFASEKNEANKWHNTRFVSKPALSELKSERTTAESIAIIGMSGIFPMASDLDQFWDNLLEGRDCIQEIPKERWDWRAFEGDAMQEINKTNIKWGGFIDGIDEFDPLFFGISPREAETMDPQQRLLMTYIWKAIEDAGYAAKCLAGTKTGIFVGIADSGYGLLLSKTNTPIESYFSTSMVQSMGPNRMSYFLNIHGPSEPVETACSSVLVAINRAASAMENGTCEMAIVGGINTILIPEIHISMSKAGALSKDGKCKTFSNEANGYVRGEGAGMLVLKKLNAAEEAGDHIYGIIRATSENHGGRANSLTAPNPKAQADLLVTAYTKAGIDPRTVTYIEAHGTGTELGDPVEINGLKAAFKELYQASGDPRIIGAPCGLGSVKTNIGHLEIAAGIASVIKVLLQLKHKTLVQSLHCQVVNPYIQLQDSPFYIVQETKEWQALQNELGRDLPRRAGVSSFGFGGTNAHIVLEEYIEKERNITNDEEPQIIVLSAKNQDRLKEYAADFLAFINRTKPLEGHSKEHIMTKIQTELLRISSEILKIDAKHLHVEDDLKDYDFDKLKFVDLANSINAKFDLQIEAIMFHEYMTLEAISAYLYDNHEAVLSNYYSDPLDNNVSRDQALNLRDLAYTLQVGREAMDERLAMVVLNIEEIKEKIHDFLAGQPTDNLLFCENVRKNKVKFEVFSKDEDASEMISHWINKKKLVKIAELWANGFEVNWDSLHQNFQYKRLSLPTYPFAKEKYWAPGNSSKISHVKNKEIGTLIDSLEFGLSLDSGIVFSKKLDNSLLIVKDHNILGLNIFPGVGYLEIAFQAATAIKGHSNFHISRVYWMHPLVVEDEKKVLITFKKENEKLLFEVQSQQKGNYISHAKGEIQDASSDDSKRTFISIEEIRLRCTDNIKGEEIYQSFKSKGMNYGPFFQGVLELYGNKEEVLGVLEIPQGALGLNYYSLHPTLLDSALQLIGYIKKFGTRPPLPFAVERVEILHPLKSKMYAYARTAGTSSYNVAIIDEDGTVCLKFYNVVLKEAKETDEDFYYRPVWKKSSISAHTELVNSIGVEEQKSTLIIYSEDGSGIVEVLAGRHGNRVHKLKLGTRNVIDTGDNCWVINTSDPEALDDFIHNFADIDTIYFLGGIQLHPDATQDLEGLYEAQESGVITLFRLIKALEKYHLLQQTIKLKIITNNIYQIAEEVSILPSAACIHGFIKSLAKEYPKLKITSIDLDLLKFGSRLTAATVCEVVEPIFREPYNKNGETITYRQEERYERVIQPIRLGSANKTIYRENGVYLIVGGAGGIGLELSRYLAKNVHARLILIGRSELDNDKKDTFKQIEALGGVVLYLQADVTDTESMVKAIKAAKARFGEINGVFHSAIVSMDKTIRNMDEETLRASLGPKVVGSTVLYSVLQNEYLDFMAFFSSTSAIVGMPGQSNYVSGLNYKDAFAKYIGKKQSYPIKIINWGFWDIGAGASDEYGRRMASQGIFAISSDEGMEAIERILGNREDQVIVLKADKGVLEKLGVSSKEEIDNALDVVFRDNRRDFSIKREDRRAKSGVAGDNAEELISDYLKSIIAEILKLDKLKIDHQTSLEEYGVDSLVGLELHANFEKSFGELPPALLLENTTVDALTNYFQKNHQNQLDMILDKTKDKVDTVDLFDNNPHQKQDINQTFHIAEPNTKQEKNNFDFPIDLNSFLVETDSKAKIEVLLEGSGPPLLLIPGFAVTTSLMVYQIRDWSSNYRVIAINLPGHGRSEGIEDLTLVGISAMIMNLIDKLGIDQPIHVVGGSFGGMIAQHIAKEYPERVASLSLLSSFSISKFESVAQLFSFAEAARKDFEIVRTNAKSKDIKDNLDYYLNVFLNSQATNQWVMVKYLDYMKLGISTLELLPEIKAPTLVVVGAVDTVVDPEQSRVIHSKILHSQYVEIPDGGHFMNLTHHQTVNELVSDFLKNVRVGK